MSTSLCLYKFLIYLLSIVFRWTGLHSTRLTICPPPLVIVNLPPEILTRITMFLNCTDLLEMRKTCKLFFSLTHTRQIWVNLLERLQENYCVCPPEDCVENYTTEELEEWVLRRELSRRVLSGSIQAKPKARVIMNNEGWKGPAFQRHILPGGRWLLAQNIYSTYAIDLDFPDRKPIPLFELSDMVPFQRDIFQDAIWVDRSESPWRYRIAVAIRVGEDTIRAHVFQLESRGHGPTATLVAERLTSFRARLDLHLWTFNRNYLIGYSDSTEIKLFHYSPTIGKSIDVLEIEPVTYLLKEDGACESLMTFRIINETTFGTSVVITSSFYVLKVVCDQDTTTPCSIRLLYKIPYLPSLGSMLLPCTGGMQMTWILQSGECQRVVLPDHGTAPIISSLGKGELDIETIFHRKGMIVLDAFSSVVFDQSSVQITDLSNCHELSNPLGRIKSYQVAFDFPIKLHHRPLPIAYIEDVGRVMAYRGPKWVFIDLI